MSNINDLKAASLEDKGYTGNLNDMEFEWLYDQGCITGTYQDRWNCYFEGLGYHGNYGDMLQDYLFDRGCAIGTVNDRMKCALEEGAFYGDPVLVFYAATHNRNPPFECVVQGLGEGVPVTDHVTSIYTQDYLGVWQEQITNSEVWDGARVVLVSGTGSAVLEHYVVDKSNVAIYPQPYLTVQGFSDAGITPANVTIEYDAANWSNTEGSFYAEIKYAGGDQALFELGVSGPFLHITGGNIVLTDGVNSISTPITTGTHYIGFAFGNGTMDFNVNTSWIGETAYTGSFGTGVVKQHITAREIKHTVEEYARAKQRVDLWMKEATQVYHMGLKVTHNAEAVTHREV